MSLLSSDLSPLRAPSAVLPTEDSPACEPRRQAGVRRAVRGFTLIEIMVTMAVMGILASIAFTAYTNQISKSRRSTARSALTDVAIRLDKYFSQNYTFVGFQLPYVDIPQQQGQVKVYTLEWAASSACSPNPGKDCYALKATRASGGPQAKDDCGDFTLDNLGTRGNVNNVKTAATCWR